MDPAVVSTPASAPPAAFEDGLGERRHTVGAGNEPLEVLRLNTVLSAVSSFEFALRERAGRLATFRHESYGRVRAVERLDKLASTLVVVSDHIPGIRLSALLSLAEQRSIPLEIDAARCLIRQLVSAVATLQERVPDTCHGAIGPERIIITPDGRLMIVEYVLGSALEQLRYSQDRYWRDLGVAIPASVGAPRFDLLVDVTQMGTVVLALLLGRRLRSDEYPIHIEEVVAGAAMRSAEAFEPMPADLREWLLRALQLDPHDSFSSAVDARANLDFALGDANPVAELGALRAFLDRCALPGAGDMNAAKPVFTNGSQVIAPSEPVVALNEPVVAASAPVIAPSAPVVTPPVPLVTPTVEVVTPTVPVVTPTARVVAATPTAVATAPSEPSQADPDAGLLALRSFLNRYPSREASERPPAKPAPPPASASVTPASQVAPSVAVSSPTIAQTRPTSPVNPIAPVNVDSGPAPSIAPLEVTRTDIRTWPRQWLVIAAVALITLTTGATLVGLWYLVPLGDGDPTGTLVVGTNPGGVAVVVDGVNRGVTPLSVDLPIGDHVLELATTTGNRRIPVRITAGGQVSQYIEMPRAGPTLGTLQIRTDPTRAEVVVDGRRLGRSPLTVQDLTAGPHTVVLENESGSQTQQVTIAPGTTASLVVSMTRVQNANAAGWISVTAPMDVQVYEGQRLLGTSRSDRIMISVGRHDLELVNEALGYRATRTVDVQAGQVSPVKPEWPQGSLALNAIPWAEVWIDGQRVGETPIGNVPIAIGAHEIIFRHPELGERRAFATVKLGAPTRVGVDLRAK